MAPTESPLASYETERLRQWRRWTDGPLILLAIGSLPFLLIEIDRNRLTYSDRVALDAVNIAVLIAFALDYIVELRLASRRGEFIRHEWTSLLIVIAQSIALLPGLAGLGALRAIRGARLFRPIAVLARLVALGGVAAREGRSLVRQHAGRLALSLAAFTWLTSAACFVLAERDTDPSTADGLWWSFATITTVGYGDIYPTTPAGRLIGGFTMLVGITSFALVTAKLAEFLVRTDRETKPTDAERSD